MRCQLQLIAILGLLLLAPSTANARRRSRVDTPIENAADAPLEDNLATASGSEDVVESLEKLPAPKDKVKDKEASKAEAALSSDQQCSSDNISFELVTGYEEDRNSSFRLIKFN